MPDRIGSVPIIKITLYLGNMQMKNVLLGVLAITCILDCGQAFGAEVDATIIEEKPLMTLGKGVLKWGKAGFRSMRLSPDGTKLLYARSRIGDDKKRAYHLILRDISTGKDKELKIPGYGSSEIVGITLSGNVFDPAGKRLAIGVGIDTNKNGRRDYRGSEPEMMQAMIYDLATDKTTRIGPEAMLVMASFNRTSKGLVLATMNMRTHLCDLYTTPMDKVELRKFDLQCVPRIICPTADILALRLPPSKANEKWVRHRIGLCDLTTGKLTAELPLPRGNSIDDYGPQWTADGRCFYYVFRIRHLGEPRVTRPREERESRIWDRTKARALPAIHNMLPVGPGPTATTMVLTPYPKRDKVMIHDATAGKTWAVAGENIRPVCSEGKYILYVRTDKEGKKILYRGKIKLPNSQPLPSASASKAGSGVIETEVEYRYLPASDPRKGAPYFRIYAKATSDHALSETEVATIRSALATHAPDRGPPVNVATYLAKRNITGVKVAPPTFEDLHYTLNPKKTKPQATK